MAYNKGLHSSSGGSQRGRPYVLLLLIIFGAALLGVMVLHKLRERRIYNLLVKEKDHQLLALQLLLQKERDRTKELRRKNGEMKEKIYALRNQKMELGRTVVEMQSIMDSLKEEQKVMESAFEETQNELRVMQQRGRNVGMGGSKITALRENLKQKEAEIKDLKEHLEIPYRLVSINDTAIFPGTVAANRTMAAQDKIGKENKEKDEHSGDSAKYGSDDKHIINEEASKGKLTMFKDGEDTIGVKDEIPNDEKLAKKNKDSQDDGSAGGTAKDVEAEVVDGGEKKASKEEQPRQLKKNKDGGGQDFNVKQLEDSSRAAAGMKRKHGHVSRTKEKNWRTIVKNRLMENNGISESHNKEVNKGNRKVYKDDQGELNDRKVGRVSDEETVVEEDGGRHNDNPRKIKPQAKLLKLENNENREDAENMIVDNTNHQVTNNGIGIHPEKERQSEEQEDNQVQQNWSRRHINKAEKNVGQTKSNMFHEEHEKLEVLDAQKPDKDESDVGNDNEDNDDDFSKDSQSDFEDEKEEYKEEIDESEFRSGL